MDGPRAAAGFRRRPAWLLPLAGLLVWQGWLVLTLFDAPDAAALRRDDRPVLSGRHPLHQYHARLGARAGRVTDSVCCYDPTFQAGYPKTPLFDGTCRPAELVYLWLGGTDHPGPYKLTLAVGCLLAPLAFVAAGRGLGLPPPAALLAGGLGLAAFWATPARRLLDAGDIDWLFGGLALVAHLGLLVRYERGGAPFVCWLGLFGTAAAGAVTHPL